MDIEKVLDEYRKGDESRRLSLFLAFRELRDQFNRIEEESVPDDLAVFRFPWTRKRRIVRAA